MTHPLLTSPAKDRTISGSDIFPLKPTQGNKTKTTQTNGSHPWSANPPHLSNREKRENAECGARAAHAPPARLFAVRLVAVAVLQRRPRTREDAANPEGMQT